MSHIFQDELLDELSRKCMLYRKVQHPNSSMIYINQHIQGLINLIDDLTTKSLHPQTETLTEEQREELNSTLEQQKLMKQLVPIVMLLQTHTTSSVEC